MTAKRFQKLLRAYFTRLNEWAKEYDKPNVMDMGLCYRTLCSRKLPQGMTRQEWWDKLKEITDTFGVGERS